MSTAREKFPWYFEGGFGIIPRRLWKDENLSPREKHILSYFLSYLGEKRYCFPSLSTIAKDVGLSRNTVVNCIHNLEVKEYIIKTKKDNPTYHTKWTEDGPEKITKQSNEYTLTFPSGPGKTVVKSRLKSEVSSKKS